MKFEKFLQLIKNTNIHKLEGIVTLLAIIDFIRNSENGIMILGC
jgi:hypothetical protein